MTQPRLSRIQLAFSLRHLFISVAFLSLLFGACVRPGGILAITWHFTVFGTISYGALAAIYRNGQARAFWLGFSIFSASFFLCEHFPILDTRKRISTIIEEELKLLPSVTEFLRPQATKTAEKKVDLGFLIPTGNPRSGQLANQTRDELDQYRRSLTNTICGSLFLIVGTLGGLLGKWLYLSSPAPNRFEE